MITLILPRCVALLIMQILGTVGRVCTLQVVNFGSSDREKETKLGMSI